MKVLPQIFYGMHFFPGCAEYREPGRDPYRIYIGEEAIKAMNASFAGRPVFVDHRDVVNLDTLQTEADGYVVESFYLPCDGQTWAKFIVTSDKAHEAIRMGWSLSNSYIIRERGPGGLNHGVDYEAEVLRGEYDHLAIVKKPRYEQSVILTPDQFKEYVERKEGELARVANSLETETEKESTVNFWKRTKVDNTADFENMVVSLPKSKTEATIQQIVNEVDQYRLEMPLPKMANDDDYVEMGEGDKKKKMNVKELKDCYNTMMAMKEEEEKKNAEMEEMKKKENETAEEQERKSPEEEKAAALKKNAEEEEEKKKKENEAKEMEMKKNKEDEEKRFNSLRDAHFTPIREERTPDLSNDRVSRGRARYGSN